MLASSKSISGPKEGVLKELDCSLIIYSLHSASLMLVKSRAVLFLSEELVLFLSEEFVKVLLD